MDHVSGSQTPAFDDLLEQFRDRLARQQYGRKTIGLYTTAVRELGRRMSERGIELEALTPAVARELMLDGAQMHRRDYAAFAARRFADFLVTIGVATPTRTVAEVAREGLRRDYEDYLRRHRGLSERTIGHCWRFADRFLAFRFGETDVDLGAITPADIAAFLQKLTTRKAPFRDKTPPTHLRNLFRFLFKNGSTKANLALCIPSVAQRYDARLPRHLKPEQVEAVLAAARREARFGRRNYAMLLLLARLGLRAAEVITIQLDDFDWRAGEMVVRGKGKVHDRIPIPPDVGEAITAYIRRDRVSSSRSLFVTGRAPHRPFKDGQVLNQLLKQAFATAGVTPPAPYVGSHVLRHSLATNLVRQGASLDEVSEVLRHRSRRSTLIYAKLDIEGLRSIAQPWPAAGGAQ